MTKDVLAHPAVDSFYTELIYSVFCQTEVVKWRNNCISSDTLQMNKII